MDMPDRNLEQMMQPKLPVGVVICFSVNGRWPRPCSTTWDIDPKTNDVVLIKLKNSVYISEISLYWEISTKRISRSA
jgi:hypothetical protein